MILTIICTTNGYLIRFPSTADDIFSIKPSLLLSTLISFTVIISWSSRSYSIILYFSW